MNNSIYIRRKTKLYLEKGTEQLSQDALFNLLKNIESLGFTLSPILAEVVMTLSESRLKSFYKQLLRDLDDLVGADREFLPMYPNFPEEVKTVDVEELYLNAYWHYLGDFLGTRLLPKTETKPREALKDIVELQVIELGSKEEFNAIFTALLGAKSSLSESDRNDMEWFIKTYNTHIFSMLPTAIPHRENLAFFVATLLKNDIEPTAQVINEIKTATDVLRIATALSDGDISLASNSKFKSISKRNRRRLLQLLENSSPITEDMLRYKNRWKRLGEILHPFEYKKRYPKTYEAFDIVRNDLPFETFNSRVEKALEGKNVSDAVQLLKTRPGDFARRLDHLLRLTEDSDIIISDFKAVAGRVSTPVLLQLHAHFKSRNSQAELRIFFPKGEVAKVQAIENELPQLDEATCNEVLSICEATLIERFGKQKSLGKVYLDEKLKDYTVPLSLRSAAKALKTIPRGSRIDLPEDDTVRFFLYWKDGISRTDIDLSALALDADSGYKFTVAYYHLIEQGIYHSGDITSAPEGASEFIDIDIPTCLKQGVRYVLMSVNSYTRQAYSDLPYCFAGFMVRQFPESGEIYEPITVENKFDLTANSKIAIPLIVDLQERKVIWTDLSLKRNPGTNNNVRNNLSSTTIINKAMTGLVKPNLYKLFEMHITARGEKTLDIQKADTIFATDQGIQPSDIDIILSEFL